MLVPTYDKCIQSIRPSISDPNSNALYILPSWGGFPSAAFGVNETRLRRDEATKPEILKIISRFPVFLKASVYNTGIKNKISGINQSFMLNY
jgi:hypothetical protein